MKKLVDFITILVPFLEPYPVWVKVLISAWVFLSAVTVLALLFVPRNQYAPANTSANDDIPTSKPLSSRIVSVAEAQSGADARVALRSKHEVRPLAEIENELQLEKIPRGTYGFMFASHFDFERDRIPVLTEDMAGPGMIEIRKLGDGRVTLLGFVSQEAALKIQTNLEATEILFFTDEWEEARTYVSIPLSRVTESNSRIFRKAYVIDLKIKPVH